MEGEGELQGEREEEKYRRTGLEWRIRMLVGREVLHNFTLLVLHRHYRGVHIFILFVST